MKGKVRTHNKVLPKAGLKCFYETFVQSSTAVILLIFCTINPRLRQYPNRYLQVYPKSPQNNEINNFLPTFFTNFY